MYDDLEQLAGYARERTEKAKQKRHFFDVEVTGLSMPKEVLHLKCDKKAGAFFVCECKGVSIRGSC